MSSGRLSCDCAPNYGVDIENATGPVVVCFLLFLPKSKLGLLNTDLMYNLLGMYASPETASDGRKIRIRWTAADLLQRCLDTTIVEDQLLLVSIHRPNLEFVSALFLFFLVNVVCELRLATHVYQCDSCLPSVVAQAAAQ